MNLKRERLFLSVCALLFAFLSADAQTKKFPSVEIKGSQIRSLRSKETGRDYDLYIQPTGDLKSGKKYPVLFVLDGQWDFKLLDSVYGGLHYDKYIPEMIIVGITYSGENPNYDELRAMDYTPTPEARHKGSGDAAKFLKFIKKDVVPFVEKNYNADPNRRILMGSLLGGLFTLYALFEEPNFFQGYVAASPAVSWDTDFSFRHEKQFAEKHKDLNARVYIAVGDSEELSAPVKEFMKTIKGRNYKNLKLETRVLEEERHAGNKPEIYNRGLRFVFKED
ncbi:MAG: alpha/beta hydrolase-fold protein [Pyrinomonadaceae bacterium]